MGRSVQDSALSGVFRRTVLKAGAAATAFATVPVAAPRRFCGRRARP